MRRSTGLTVSERSMMDHYELIQRAMNDEVIGDGRKQIAALLDYIKGLKDRNQVREDCWRADRRARHFWEGKFAVLRHENNKLRAAMYRKTMNDQAQT